MIIPIRCFTCGKELSSKWGAYTKGCAQNDNKGEVLDNLGLRRPCCRTVMLTTVDIMQKILKFEYPQETPSDNVFL